MKIFLKHCILISLLFLVFDSFAQTQQVKFNLVTGTNGVSLGKINGIVRDKYEAKEGEGSEFIIEIPVN